MTDIYATHAHSAGQTNISLQEKQLGTVDWCHRREWIERAAELPVIREPRKYSAWHALWAKQVRWIANGEPFSTNPRHLATRRSEGGKDMANSLSENVSRGPVINGDVPAINDPALTGQLELTHEPPERAGGPMRELGLTPLGRGCQAVRDDAGHFVSLQDDLEALTSWGLDHGIPISAPGLWGVVIVASRPCNGRDDTGTPPEAGHSCFK